MRPDIRNIGSGRCACRTPRICGDAVIKLDKVATAIRLCIGCAGAARVGSGSGIGRTSGGAIHQCAVTNSSGSCGAVEWRCRAGLRSLIDGLVIKIPVANKVLI